MFVLISDGHGQEYWNVVQATGKRLQVRCQGFSPPYGSLWSERDPEDESSLQDTKAELFAVSASRDYNEAELLIYVGDKSRVFVGQKYNG